MSDFAVSALLRPPYVGAQFTRLQLRPPPPRVGRPAPAQFWAPISGRPRRGFVAAHCAVRWPSNVGRPPRPTICAHLAPRSAPTSDHLAPTLGRHPRPPGLPRSASTWLHVPRPPPSIWPPTLGRHSAPPSASTPAHLAVHHSRLGAATIPAPVHLHRTVRWTPNFRQPIGTPPTFRAPTLMRMGVQFRPRFSSPLGVHPSPSPLASRS